MAYTKIITIRTRGGIRNATKYIENEEKTQDRGRKTADYDVQGAIDYVTDYAENDKKTEGKRLVTAINCTLADSAGEMRDLAAYWKQERDMQDNDRDAYHVIQSFDPKDNDKLTADEVHKMGIEYANRIMQIDDKKAVNRKYMMIVATHTDKNHFHNHIVFCAYDMNSGKKYHECRETYRMLREANDEICREHGLRVIEEPGRDGNRSHFEEEMRKNGSSWKDLVRQDIDEVKKSVTGWPEFKEKMQDKGYSLREGKYVTYTTPEGHKVRDVRLGDAYRKDSLTDFWEYPEEDREPERQEEKEKEKENKKEEEKERQPDRTPLDRRKLLRLMRQMDAEDMAEQRKRRLALADQTSWYDSDGRMRTAEEMLVIMVMEMMSKGDYYGVSAIKSGGNVNMQAERMDQLYQTASLMRFYNFPSADAMRQKKDDLGKKVAVSGKALWRAENRLKKLQQIQKEAEAATKYKDLIDYLSSLPEGQVKEKEREKYKTDIDDYKKHQSFLYKNGAGKAEDQEKAISEIPQTMKTVARLREENKKYRAEYRTLSRILNNLEKAQNPDYAKGKSGRKTKDGQRIPSLYSLSRVTVDRSSGNETVDGRPKGDNNWKLTVDTTGFPDSTKAQIEADAASLSRLYLQRAQEGEDNTDIQNKIDALKDKLAMAIVKAEGKEQKAEAERDSEGTVGTGANKGEAAQQTDQKPKTPGFYSLDRVKVDTTSGWRLIIDTAGFRPEVAATIDRQKEELSQLYWRRAKTDASKDLADEIRRHKQQMAKEIVEEEALIKERTAEREEPERTEETKKHRSEAR